MFCDHCGHPCTPLPVEPLYGAASVCMLVPAKYSTIKRWATKHKGVLDGPYYTGPRTRRRRLFTAGDIRKLRAALVSTTP
jgi:hypothetical protein